MFQIFPLPRATFAHLIGADEATLAAHNARRVTAVSQPGYPCRVSLADAAPGETLLLVHHTHHDAATPYRASHAVYVRETATEAAPGPDEVPAVLRTRLLSLRAFDEAGMMRAADVVEGTALEPALEALLAQPEHAEVHIHFAKPGCYAARARRV